MRAFGIVALVLAGVAAVAVVAIVAHFRYRTRDLGRPVRSCGCGRGQFDERELRELLDDALGEEL